MKIIFICGSLELGKDGVGDYSRRLAGELLRQGYNSAIISLNDKYCNTLIEEIQTDENTFINTLRIPSNINWDMKISKSQIFIDAFKPDWLSLQFVPYSYNNKGLPFLLPARLKQLGGEYKWHIMFHELWIGISSISPLRHKIVGYFQQKIVRSIVRTIKPRLITTSNLLYQSVLTKAGILSSHTLSLFSNIEVAAPDVSFAENTFRKLGITREEIVNWDLIGIFGNLYTEANLEKIILEQYEQSINKRKGLAFIAFGRMNSDGINELKRLENIFNGKARFLYLGEQSPVKVSQLLQILHYGISCTPVQHLGKSGVYAAMKLHGLKVLFSSYDYLPEYDKIIKKSVEEMEVRKSYEWGVEHVSRRFLALLEP